VPARTKAAAAPRSVAPAPRTPAAPAQRVPTKFDLDKWAPDLLAQLDPEDDENELLDSVEVANWLRVARQWLDNGRRLGYGPRFVCPDGFKVFYRRRDVIDFIESRTFEPGQTKTPVERARP